MSEEKVYLDSGAYYKDPEGEQEVEVHKLLTVWDDMDAREQADVEPDHDEEMGSADDK